MNQKYYFTKARRRALYKAARTLLKSPNVHVRRRGQGLLKRLRGKHGTD
jgi:hypothetical protein